MTGDNSTPAHSKRTVDFDEWAAQAPDVPRWKARRLAVAASHRFETAAIIEG